MFKKMLGWGVTVSLIILCSCPAFSQTEKLKQRAEIDAKYQWKLTDLYASDQAWEKDVAWLKENYVRITQFQGKLGTSAENLLRALKLRDSLGIVAENLSVYAKLSLDQDNRVSKYQEMSDRIGTLNSQVSGASSYIEPEILLIDRATLDQFLATSQPLTEYRFCLDALYRTKAHILSDKEEALLAKAGPVFDAFGRIFGMANDADITYDTIKDENGKEVELSKGRLDAMSLSPDRRVRRDANQAYYRGYLRFLNTLSATLSSSVKKDDFIAKAREYSTTLEMQLDGDNIPISVFQNLIDAVNTNLGPLHKWAALRKRVMKIDTLHCYDLRVPLFQAGQQKYSYDQAKEIVLNGLQPLGEFPRRQRCGHGNTHPAGLTHGTGWEISKEQARQQEKN